MKQIIISAIITVILVSLSSFGLYMLSLQVLYESVIGAVLLIIMALLIKPLMGWLLNSDRGMKSGYD